MNQSDSHDPASHSPSTAVDPVCGMSVDPGSAKYSSEYEGQTYYFCSLMCLNAFEDQPQQYLLSRSGNH